MHQSRKRSATYDDDESSAQDTSEGATPTQPPSRPGSDSDGGYGAGAGAGGRSRSRRGHGGSTTTAAEAAVARRPRRQAAAKADESIKVWIRGVGWR